MKTSRQQTDNARTSGAILKILISCGSPSWGGLEMYTLQLAQQMARRGHRVVLLCAPGSALQQHAANSVPTIPLLLDKWAIPRSILAIRRLLRSSDFDVIHTHLSHDLGVLVPAIHLANWKGKLILSKHMGSAVNKKDILHRFLYRRVHRILAISTFIRESVLKTCPVLPEQVLLFQNAISLERLNPDFYDRGSLRRAFSIPAETTVIGMIGRMTPKKGHTEFLQAAAMLVKKFQKPLLFLIIGEASRGEEIYEKKLRRMAFEELELGEQVRFMGFQPDIPGVLAVMDVLAFPSYKEAFGITLLEAMAMCVPVVASNSGAVPDIVVDGQTGILVPPRSAEALARGILKLIKSPGLRTRLGLAGRIRVEERFSMVKYLDRLERVYREVERYKDIGD